MSIADRQKPAPGELFLDHVSHFVPELDAAARLLERLGFVVTPTSVQVADGKPVGASNRCVMLEEGYIELLTPTLDTPTARRMRERMKKFVGVHVACFGTPDAEAEHARLAAHGFEPQPLVKLERKVDGRHTVKFRVVRPKPEALPEGRIQYVQQMTPRQIWKPKYLEHKNGVIGLAAVYVAASDPAETAARWARFAGLVYLQATRGSVFVGPGSEPAIVGYALRCKDPTGFLSRCKGAGLEVRANTVALPPRLGAAWFVV
jgi:glyoxalase-like protein